MRTVVYITTFGFVHRKMRDGQVAVLFLRRKEVAVSGLTDCHPDFLWDHSRSTRSQGFYAQNKVLGEIKSSPDTMLCYIKNGILYVSAHNKKDRSVCSGTCIEGFEFTIFTQ